jgi:DnaJ-class molecular chaperone
MHPDATQSCNNTSSVDLYGVLGVADTQATVAELRQAFLDQARSLHPDKGGDPALFAQLQNAWEVLGDPESRLAYDERCRVNTGRTTAHVEVDLDDFDFNSELGVFSRVCRCGAAVQISEDQLEVGVELVECPACSLCIRVLYEAAVAASDDEA